ncbi:MAG TPA: DUF5597 domain-containing protein [Tepidisphaeraceae bacterium]|jgi:hypothetical protein|nr:DUF5597 domain-containing protein [Tepidisphaeraceae bacterium]
MIVTEFQLRWVLFVATAILAIPLAQAQGDDASLPHIVQKDGRYALFVDGAPYLILGAQVNNSSGWPAVLPKVWPAMEFMHVNTVEIPVYWEQFEPEKGKFDYSVVNTLLAQAREHKFHLVLLWFGTWKNGSNHYMPRWMKLDPARYPNIIGPDGKYVDSPSPLAKETLAADVRAFVTLMTHLKEADSQHTVLMVQVENEPGTWGAVRDYSPQAQRLFESPVPTEVLAAMHKTGLPESANWRDAFGDDADEYFHVWCVSKYVGQVAAAGKAIDPLPMYVNASVRDPFKPGYPPKYEVGGPNDNVFPIWKTEAPAIDLLAPDIYQRESAHYLKILDFYHRLDNPLFIPETIGQGPYARFLFAAIGRGAIGYSPFGLDDTRTFYDATDVALTPEQTYSPTAQNCELIGPMMRDIARLSFDGKLQTAVDERNPPNLPTGTGAEIGHSGTQLPDQILHFGAWDAPVWFARTRRGFGPTPRTAPPLPPNGRALVAQLGENQFLVTGLYCHVGFQTAGDAAKKPWQYLSVKEGKYEDGVFQPIRILNGDQTDHGLFFRSAPAVLRVTLYTR